jgi:inosine-uridine nucleoside N-ribohydrolase
MTLCDARHLREFDLTPIRGHPESHDHRGEAPNAEVAVAVNADRFWEMFLDVLATYP